ncbi:MAG TPA: hypothetical protein VFD51_00170 [Patescibacteria group bacterium]|nr:hypothetical protein [Patescibacteria group bacterium]
MIQRIGKIIILIIVAISLALIQFSFFPSLPGLAQYFYPGLIVLIFILFFSGLKLSLYFILIFGLVLDILSFQFFGIYTISMAVAVIIAAFILQNFLTNKSLYSLGATILIFTFSYNILLASLDFIFSGFVGTLAISQLSFWKTLLYQAMWGLLAAVSLFHLLVLWFNRFKPFFLENKETM